MTVGTLGAGVAAVMGLDVGFSMMGLAVGLVTGELEVVIGLVVAGMGLVGVAMGLTTDAVGLSGEALRSLAPESDVPLLLVDVPTYAPSPTAINTATMVAVERWKIGGHPRSVPEAPIPHTPCSVDSDPLEPPRPLESRLDSPNGTVPAPHRQRTAMYSLP